MPKRRKDSGVETMTVDLPMLHRALPVRADTVDEEARTVEVVFATDTPIERRSFFSGKTWREVLTISPKAIRAERLDGGAPLLNSHNRFDLRDVIGVVEAGSLRFEKGQALVRVRFSQREEVEPIFRDVVAGIIRNVSVGYLVRKFVEEEENGVTTRTAVDWEPIEISLTPVGADAGAGVRAQDTPETHPCVIETRALDGAESTKENEDMPKAKKNDEASVAEDIRSASDAPSGENADNTRAGGDGPLPAPAGGAEQPNEQALRAQGAEDERTRISGIRATARKLGINKPFADELVEKRVLLETANARMIDEAAKEDERTPTRAVIGSGDYDEVSVRRTSIASALLHRQNPDLFELEQRARDYMGLTLMETCREILRENGEHVRGLGPGEVAARALATSDLANIVLDAANKSLTRGFTETPRTFVRLARRTTLPDFKLKNMISLGEAASLSVVNENGEFTHGAISDRKETYSLVTYGKLFAVTRQTIINDDLDALTRLPQLFGSAAARVESDVVWGLVTANGNMSDGVKLFHATHGNLAGSGAVPSVATLGAGRKAMRKQKGLDGEARLNIGPSFLVGPTDLETIVDQLLATNIIPTKIADQVPEAFRKLVPITEARLDDNSTAAWYLVADPNEIDTLEYATLEGQESVFIESRLGWERDGLEFKIRHDFGAGVPEHRGMYKNPGT